jgi:hypothetical protein
MTDLSTDEMMKRIVQSLKENSAELAKERRDEQQARARQIVLFCIIFITGIAAGTLLATAL